MTPLMGFPRLTHRLMPPPHDYLHIIAICLFAFIHLLDEVETMLEERKLLLGELNPSPLDR